MGNDESQPKTDINLQPDSIDQVYKLYTEKRSAFKAARKTLSAARKALLAARHAFAIEERRQKVSESSESLEAAQSRRSESERTEKTALDEFNKASEAFKKAESDWFNVQSLHAQTRLAAIKNWIFENDKWVGMIAYLLTVTLGLLTLWLISEVNDTINLVSLATITDFLTFGIRHLPSLATLVLALLLLWGLLFSTTRKNCISAKIGRSIFLTGRWRRVVFVIFIAIPLILLPASIPLVISLYSPDPVISVRTHYGEHHPSVRRIVVTDRFLVFRKTKSEKEDTPPIIMPITRVACFNTGNKANCDSPSESVPVNHVYPILYTPTESVPPPVPAASPKSQNAESFYSHFFLKHFMEHRTQNNSCDRLSMYNLVYHSDSHDLVDSAFPQIEGGDLIEYCGNIKKEDALTVGTYCFNQIQLEEIYGRVDRYIKGPGNRLTDTDNNRSRKIDIFILGFASQDGSSQYNLELSEKRTKDVEQRLYNGLGHLLGKDHTNLHRVVVGESYAWPPVVPATVKDPPFFDRRATVAICWGDNTHRELTIQAKRH